MLYVQNFGMGFFFLFFTFSVFFKESFKKIYSLGNNGKSDEHVTLPHMYIWNVKTILPSEYGTSNLDIKLRFMNKIKLSFFYRNCVMGEKKRPKQNICSELFELDVIFQYSGCWQKTKQTNFTKDVN